MKTAAQLGLTEGELEALIKVRDLLDAGLIEHDPDSNDNNHNRPTQPRFDIGVIREERSCGTTLCIGGWTKLIDLGIAANERGHLPISSSSKDIIDTFVMDAAGGLRNLFYPNSIGDWDKITPKRAVAAINNVLEFGYPKWRKVLAEVPAT